MWIETVYSHERPEDIIHYIGNDDIMVINKDIVEIPPSKQEPDVRLWKCKSLTVPVKDSQVYIDLANTIEENTKLKADLDYISMMTDIPLDEVM